MPNSATDKLQNKAKNKNPEMKIQPTLQEKNWQVYRMPEDLGPDFEIDGQSSVSMSKNSFEKIKEKP